MAETFKGRRIFGSKICTEGKKDGVSVIREFRITETFENTPSEGRKGLKVVFLHGLGQTARDWQQVIDLTLLLRLMPSKSFDSIGLSKRDAIRLSHSMRSLDFSQKLGEVVCPVSIVCGEKDNANLKASRQLKALLPHSELHIIPGAGHEVNKSAPEAVSDIIRKFIFKVDHVEMTPFFENS